MTGTAAQYEATLLKFLGEIQDDANQGQLGYESVKIGLSKQLVSELAARVAFLEGELLVIAGTAGIGLYHDDDFNALGVLHDIRAQARAACLPAKTIEAA